MKESNILKTRITTVTSIILFAIIAIVFYKVYNKYRQPFNLIDSLNNFSMQRSIEEKEIYMKNAKRNPGLVLIYYSLWFYAANIIILIIKLFFLFGKKSRICNILLSLSTLGIYYITDSVMFERFVNDRKDYYGIVVDKIYDIPPEGGNFFIYYPIVFILILLWVIVSIIILIIFLISLIPILIKLFFYWIISCGLIKLHLDYLLVYVIISILLENLISMFTKLIADTMKEG